MSDRLKVYKVREQRETIATRTFCKERLILRRTGRASLGSYRPIRTYAANDTEVRLSCSSQAWNIKTSHNK